MRQLTAADLAVLASPHYAVHVRVLVTDADGVERDLTDLEGIDWFAGAEWGEDIDQPIVQPRIEIRREVAGTGLSLSPFDESSPLNRRANGSYAPLIDAGRRIRILTATVPPGSVPAPGDWREVFDGEIDEVEWQTDPMLVVCRDPGGKLQDTIIEDPQEYGSEQGVLLHVVMQQLLDDVLGPGVVTLHVPEPPAFMVTRYRPDEGPLLEALQACAGVIGWDVRYVWNETSQAFELTLIRPDREKTTPDHVFGPDDYIDVTRLAVSRADVRNVVEVRYQDSGTHQQERVTVQDDASIARYGRRYMRIVEGEDSPIDTAPEALAMAEAALSDLAEPKAEQEIELRYFWPAQLGDLYLFRANGVHYTTDQVLAVVGIRHRLTEGQQRTVLTCRGRPSGGYLTWLKRSKREPDSTVTLYAECQARVIASDATSVTVQVDAVPDYGEVWLVGLIGAQHLSGPGLGVPAPSGTQWKFNRPAFQAGEGQAVFRATAPGYESDDDHIVIPEQGRDTVPLLMRARVLSVTGTQIVVRVAVADPFPGSAITIAYSATGGTGLAVTPGSPQTIPAGSVTANIDTTGFVDFTITRPEAGSGGGRVTFTASASGRVSDVDAVDVPELPPEVVGAVDVLVIMPRWVYSGADAHLELVITYGSLWRSLRVEYQYSSVPGGQPDTRADYVFDLQAGGGNTIHLVEDADGLVRFWSPDDPPPTITITPYEGPNGTGRAGTPHIIQPEELSQSGAVGGRVGTTDDPGTVYQADRILFQHPTSLGFRIDRVNGIPVVRLDGVASVQQGGTGLSSSPGKGDLLVGDGEGGYALLSRGASGRVLQVTGDVVHWGPVPSHTHTFGDITGQAKPSQLGIGADGAIVKKAKDSDSFISVTGQPGEVLTWDDLAGWVALPPPVPPDPLPPASAAGRFLQALPAGGEYVWFESFWGLPTGVPPARRFLMHDGTPEGQAQWSWIEPEDIAGVLSPSQIPVLDASKITSGVFDPARIPNLDAGKITSGTFSVARIPDLDASKITSGTFHVDRIPVLPPSKISGQLAPSQLGITVDGAIVKKAKDSDSFISVTGQPGEVLTWDDPAGWVALPLPTPPQTLPTPSANNRFLQSAGSGWLQSIWGLPPGPPPDVRRFLAHDGDEEGEAYWSLPTAEEVGALPLSGGTVNGGLVVNNVVAFHTVAGGGTGDGLRPGGCVNQSSNVLSFITNGGSFPSTARTLVFQYRILNQAAAYYDAIRITDAGSLGSAVLRLMPAGGSVTIGGTPGVYTLDVGGSIRATNGVYDTSDIRLKKDVVPLVEVFDPIALLLTLHPVRFRWKQTGEPDIGLVAQQSPTPFLGPDGLTIAYHRIVATLVAGWQAHERRLRALELALEEVRRGLA